MYKSLLYKEWLKIKWAFWGITLLSLLVLLLMMLNVAYDMEQMTPKGYWSYVIQLGYQFFTDLQYLPVLAGVVIAIAQFSPEMNNSRLKLTMHLPVKENSLLFQMISIGFILLVALFVLIAVLLGIITGIYFPSEVVYSALNATFPWLACGIAAYFLATAIIIEPIWSRRLILLPFSLGFLDLFISVYNTHINLDLFFLFSCLVTSILILFPAYHFKRGI
ncbi:MAG: ABC transporter permease [Ignavibacteriaceae bacterium]|nr:ABC transporter permease [Ignavibacteriaceae bacterium]